MTYIPKRRVQAEPEISPRDAHADWIIVPNIALLVSCPPQRDVTLYSKIYTVHSLHINKQVNTKATKGTIFVLSYLY